MRLFRRLAAFSSVFVIVFTLVAGVIVLTYGNLWTTNPRMVVGVGGITFHLWFWLPKEHGGRGPSQ
jgi:hypothetical protein